MGKTKKDYVIQFDGLVEPYNPGGHGCYGYVLWRSKIKTVKRGYLGQGPEMTNNWAEWSAVAFALQEIIDNDNFEEIDSILILGDSKLVVKQLSGDWRCKSESMKKFREKCVEMLEKIGADWSAHWVPREINEEADKLGREAYNLELALIEPEE